MNLTKPAWVQDNITEEDAAWLTDLISETKPVNVVEIGIGSGWSSLAILRALRANGPLGHLMSWDNSERCRWSPDHAIGSVVEEIDPSLLSRWIVSIGTSAKTANDIPCLLAGWIDLLFIDGDHGHPWPCYDLLNLLPFMSPGKWVVLHDINMLELGGTSLGAINLFECWPKELKRRLEIGQRNIGAVRLPDDLHQARIWLLDCVWSKSWEHPYPELRAELKARFP